MIESPIELHQIYDLESKKKWQRLFLKEYEGQARPESEKYYGDNVKFFEAIQNGKKLGFVRCNNKTSFFMDQCKNEVWCLADAYVLKDHRSHGVLKEMIRELVAKHKVKMLHIDKGRYYYKHDYYCDLGFTHVVYAPDEVMLWVFHKSFSHIVEALDDT